MSCAWRPLPARVDFPKLTEKGQYGFRLRMEGSQDVTGATTTPYAVRVR